LPAPTLPTPETVARDRLRRAESLERTMLALRDARETYDVLSIVARGLGFDFKRPCVAYEFRDGVFRSIAASDPGHLRPFSIEGFDLETLRRGAIIRSGTDDVVGILSDGQLRAVLTLEHGAMPLDPEESRYLRALSAHVSLALSNAHAFDQLRRYAAEGAALTEAARMILGFSELEPLAAALCRMGTRLLSADRAAVYAPRAGALRVLASSVSRPEFTLPESIAENPAEAVAALEQAFTGQAIVARPLALPLEQRAGDRADDRNAEATGLLVFARPGRFDKNDLRLIQTFINLAALAIRNVDLYEQSVRANRALAESNAFKDDLMAMFAHDFKGPLTVISGFSELMLDVDDPDVQRSATTIVEQTKRLAKLSDDALALAATQSAGFSLQRTPNDLAEFVRAIALPFDRDGERIEIVAPDEPLIVSFDKSRLRHVVDNVVGNALKYSSGLVTITIEQDGLEARVRVADRGIGIPPAELDFIFARFGRGTNARSRGISGSGVGLYIAKKIVDVHAGRLEVVSTENEGSTFTLVLPA
jgi:signal transduction histidine kinase